MSKYGLSVLGKIRVFRKDKEIQGKGKKSFTVHDVWFNVSEQDESGNYFNKSMNLIFKRGLELPENNTVIQIISAFPVITGQGEYRRIALLVEAWETPETKNYSGDNTPFEVKDEDIPF
jgi:hypothetical protein